ncbi:threonine aldolase [Sorangium cellulosum]|uniref:Threonine aldolase n=1 Tax=Sorangium cellulosum TaxID=56 RepID=A0A2L0EP39_SORCE|nr:GntG family PLP-dependent aldolase [Sorangium cellulosum]AUX41071.1 threonine aldolase [Sorangium cellulosum]
MQAMIDLRSDTVTRPTATMRAAMAAAEVGDDVYREDPTVRRLEERVAELTGKEAALFVPSGTMGNQIALLCHTQRGDEVIAGEGAHCAYYESGAAPAWSGVQFAFAGRGGLFTAEDVEHAIKPPQYYLPRTRVVAIENTHNRAGGRVFPQRDVLAIASVARAHGLALHLDGARIWNAAVASGRTVAELAAPFDTASVCFSKGLGAPVGSALAGSADVVRAALRFRKMLGGGMRQAGVLAAAALHALTHHQVRLAEDHEAARTIARAMREAAHRGSTPPAADTRAAKDTPAATDAPHATVGEPETNIVYVETPGIPAERLVEAARQRGVLVGAADRSAVRIVTHLDLAPAQVAPAARALAEALAEVLALPRERGGAGARA